MSNGWHRKTPNTPAEQARRREYDSPEYRARRKQNRALIDSGRAHCWRCHQWIPPGTGHTGHPHLLPECQKCNLHDGAVRGAKTRNAARQVFKRPTR